MPYRKGSLAEQAGRQRRTAKRRIARLEKEISKTKSDAERLFFRQQIDVLRDQIQRTYQRNPQTNKATGFDRDSVRIAVQNLQRQNVVSALGTSNQQRRNFMTTQELNRAQYHDFIGPVQSEFTREEVSIFYRATQRAWEGLSSLEDRNRAILEYFGRSDLKSFVREVLDINQQAVMKSEQEASSLYRAPEEIENEEARDNRQGSPSFLAYVHVFNSPEEFDVLAETIQAPTVNE